MVTAGTAISLAWQNVIEDDDDYIPKDIDKWWEDNGLPHPDRHKEEDRTDEEDIIDRCIEECLPELDGGNFERCLAECRRRERDRCE